MPSLNPNGESGACQVPELLDLAVVRPGPMSASLLTAYPIRDRCSM